MSARPVPRAAGIDPGLLDRLRDAVGPKGWTDDPADIAPHLEEPRGKFHGATPILLKPATTAEVAAIVTLCADARVGIVPQGGNTGLVGGQIPSPAGDQVLLSLTRMQAIRAVDPRDNSLTAEAGCTLVSVQEAAEAADRLFPLSLASEGTARIGGLVSTNAGGTGVLRYGSMRDLVLGLEVVLADGRVWNGLRSLRKDNTGYDIKQWFVGAEGTLGIVTAAVLKLFPRPRAMETALIGVPDPEAAIDLLSLARGLSGEQVTAFELMPRIGIELVIRHLPGAADPLAERHPWYVLLELSSGGRADLLARTMEDVLAEALERGLARDAVVAKSAEQAKALWRLRESLSEVQGREGGSIKHDISVPVSAMAAFIAKAGAAVEAEMPGIRPVPFGHVGDGNVHFNLSQPVGMDRAAYLSQWDRFARIVHDIADGFGGSISAEHGLGQLKNNDVTRYREPLETELMRRLKHALDPDGILNPGKVLPD